MNPRPPFYLLSIAANAERHKLASGEPWLLLMDLVWPGAQAASPDTPQQHLRLVRDVDPCTFDAGDGNGPQQYQPFNFTMGDIDLSSTGKVPTLEIQASNVMRVVQTLIEQYAGVVGATVYLYAVNAANPAGEPDLMLQFTVAQSICDAKTVRLKLGAPSPLRRLFPIHMYRPNYCISQYKSGIGCTYSGDMPSCTHTLDGATGCEAHFPANAVLPFGGFPGISSSGFQAASVT